MIQTPMTRRGALRAAGHGVAAMTALSYSKILGANERVNLGLIGSGDRGQGVMGAFQRTNIVDVKADSPIIASCSR